MNTKSTTTDKKQELIEAIVSLAYPCIQIIGNEEERILSFLIENKQNIASQVGVSDVKLVYQYPTSHIFQEIEFENNTIKIEKKAGLKLLDVAINETDNDLSRTRNNIKTISDFLLKQKLIVSANNKQENFKQQFGLIIIVLSRYSDFIPKGDHDDRTQTVLNSFEKLIRDHSLPTILLLSINPKDQFPEHLSRLCRTIDFPLPDIEEAGTIISKYAGNSVDKITQNQMASNVLGLLSSDIRSLSIRLLKKKNASSGELLELVSTEKQKIIKSSRSLELVEPKETINDVGGLENLKKWLLSRARYYKDRESASNFEGGIERPKGLLLVGLPGTGKSLSAKAARLILNIPLIRFDVAATFEKWVGSSEENMRAATNVAEAMAPCILWIDEIEKAFSGMGSGGGGEGGGTGTRNFGHFLTWMQECPKDVFIFATANDIQSLQRSNPEFFRYGRFDERFFLDLPKPEDRKKIWEVHTKKRIKSFVPSKKEYDELVLLSENWTGAEIEAAVKDAKFTSFGEGKNKLEFNDLISACKKITPQSVTSEGIKQMREMKDILKFQDA